MKAIYFFIYLIFFHYPVLMAQPEKPEIKTVGDFELKGKVKQVIINVEDDSGAPISGIFDRSIKLLFTPEGFLQYKGWLNSPNNTTYTYDKAGHLLREKFIYKDSFSEALLSSEEVYTYNALGLLTKKTTLREGKVATSESYLYDSNGHLRQMRSHTGTVYLYKNRYDTQKRIFKIEKFLQPSNYLTETTDIIYLANGWSKHVITSESVKSIIEFDEKGRQRSKTTYDLSSGGKFYLSCKYDDNDNKINSQRDEEYKTYTFNNLGELLHIHTTGFNEASFIHKRNAIQDYVYLRHDEKGNWIERTVTYVNINMRETEKRTIEYYE